MKNSALYFIIVCIGLWIIACTWPEAVVEPEQPQSEEVVLDSCELTNYVQPLFRCVSQRQTSDLPMTARIKWRGEERTWIVLGMQTANISSLVIDIINQYITYNQVFVIDNTTTDNGVMDIRYIVCFTNPNGLWQEGVQDLIYTEWTGHKQAAWVQSNRSLWLNDIAIDANQVDNLLDALPSVKKFGMRGNGLDSASIDIIHASILSGCKTGLTVDTSDMPMSAERLEQYIYQQITLQ